MEDLKNTSSSKSGIGRKEKKTHILYDDNIHTCKKCNILFAAAADDDNNDDLDDLNPDKMVMMMTMMMIMMRRMMTTII